jgi:hypothetical protein
MKHTLTLLLVFFSLHASIAQVNDPKIVENIYNKVNEIKSLLDETKLLKDEIKTLKKLQVSDSLTIAEKEKRVIAIASENEKLIKEKDILIDQKKQSLTDLNNFKSEIAGLSEKQLDILLNDKEYDIKSQLILSKNLMSSMLNFAQKSSSTKFSQLNYLVEIYDSIASINKIFELEYNELKVKETITKIESIALRAKQKLPNNSTIFSELNSLKERAANYCKKTLDLYEHFYRYNDDKDFEQFKKRVDMGYFIAYKYKYLLTLLAKYVNDSNYRSQFDRSQLKQFMLKPPFTCN